MKTAAPRSRQESRNRANSNAPSRPQNSQGLSVAPPETELSDFEDNRPEGLVQNQLQGPAANSPQVQKEAYCQALANNGPQVTPAAQLQAMANTSPPVQAQSDLQEMIDNSPRLAAQRKQMEGIVGGPGQRPENKTGLPDTLKAGIENLSGLSLAEVKVHYNSPKPARLQALAYTQGPEIHVGPGQERYLPHEAWHTVQQKQGRVKPTGQSQGRPINEHPALEREADVMGAKALQSKRSDAPRPGRFVASTPTDHVIQRRNGAIPENFRVTSAEKIDREVKVITHHAWTSSTGNAADLIDVEMRERVVFNRDPTINIPGYASWVNNPINRATLNGATLIKNSGSMAGLSATDEHSGAGYNPSFRSEGGAQNLQRAAWTLTATQHYQYKPPDGDWTNLHDTAFTLTRQMQQVDDHYELTFRKSGPGVNETAGPTPIAERNTKQDMEAIYGTRPNQNAEWDTAKQQIQNAGFDWETIETETRDVAGGRTVPVTYWKVVPARDDVDGASILSEDDVTTMKSNIKSGVTKVISDIMTAGNPIPTRIQILLSGLGDPRQQSWYVEPALHERVFIILFKKSSMKTFQTTGSLPGVEAAKGWTEKGKRERWQKATAIHEMGHMMQALTTPAKFITATETTEDLAGRYQRRAAREDPPRNIDQNQALREATPEEVHVAQINSRIKTAVARKYVSLAYTRWQYGAMGNPAEIVGEVFTALTQGRTVPQGLAAVYLAYGGVRSGTIERRLSGIFDGHIPTLTQPEQALPFIERDPAVR